MTTQEMVIFNGDKVHMEYSADDEFLSVEGTLEVTDHLILIADGEGNGKVAVRPEAIHLITVLNGE